MNVIGQVALSTAGLGLWAARTLLLASLLGGSTETPTPAPTPTESPSPTASVAPSPRAISKSPKPKPTLKRTTQQPAPSPVEEPDDAYYSSCAAAKRAGAAPLYRGDPGYRRGLDRDNDGVACE